MATAVTLTLHDAALYVQQEYFRKVSVVLHDNLERESHESYGLPTLVT